MAIGLALLYFGNKYLLPQNGQLTNTRFLLCDLMLIIYTPISFIKRFISLKEPLFNIIGVFGFFFKSSGDRNI